MPETPWIAASADVPDADIMVLACNAKTESYWICTYGGMVSWYDAETLEERRVTHWMHLPEVPRP